MSEFHLNIGNFFWLAQERQEIRRKRQCYLEPPWTHDPVLRDFRFCNVHRRDDKVSQWIIKNLYEPLDRTPRLFMAAVIARWFNKIETLELIRQELVGDFDLEVIRDVLSAHTGGPLFGAAYIIQSPTGKTKLDGILWAIENVYKKAEEGARLSLSSNSMERVHAWLLQFPHLGPFMAYQIVCDLTYTSLLSNPVDKMAWTCAGPGAARGMGWLCHDDPDAFNYNGEKDQGIMRAHMLTVLEMSQDPKVWEPTWGAWELATVQHWSCEYDKWRRGHVGQRLKRRFEPCK